MNVLGNVIHVAVCEKCGKALTFTHEDVKVLSTELNGKDSKKISMEFVTCPKCDSYISLNNRLACFDIIEIISPDGIKYVKI